MRLLPVAEGPPCLHLHLRLGPTWASQWLCVSLSARIELQTTAPLPGRPTERHSPWGGGLEKRPLSFLTSGSPLCTDVLVKVLVVIRGLHTAVWQPHRDQPCGEQRGGKQVLSTHSGPARCQNPQPTGNSRKRKTVLQTLTASSLKKTGGLPENISLFF